MFRTIFAFQEKKSTVYRAFDEHRGHLDDKVRRPKALFATGSAVATWGWQCFFFVKWGIFSLCVCHRAFSGKLGLNFKIPRVKLWFALAVSLNFSSPRANTSYGIDKLFFCFHFFISVSVGDICRYSMYKPWWKFKRRNNRCTLCCLAKQWVKNCTPGLNSSWNVESFGILELKSQMNQSDF